MIAKSEETNLERARETVVVDDELTDEQLKDVTGGLDMVWTPWLPELEGDPADADV
jgi:hypothetical protein